MSTAQKLPIEEAGRRMLVVLYRISCGAPIAVKQSHWEAECDRLGIFDMSLEEFERFRADAVKQFSPALRQN